MTYNFSSRAASLKPSAIREMLKAAGPGTIAFSAGNPSAESFPVDSMAKISAEIFSETPVEALQYSITEGYPSLRRQLENRIKEKFGIDSESNTLIITSGGQQGIDLVAKALLNEGDTVICECPSFIGALNAFRSYNAKLVGIEMENDGINTDKLEKALKENMNVKLMYLIPTFQNPTGITMSLEKRKKVLELARKYDIVVIEDNPYGDLRFAGDDIPTIKSMDTDGRVVYCSSFSKILSAGMRIGYISGGDELIGKVTVLKQTNDVHTNIFFQILCFRYISEYDLDAHIEDIRKIYRRKCSLMISEMEKKFPASVRFTRPEGGLFIWVTLPDGYDSAKFAHESAKRKVSVVPGSTFLCDMGEKSSSFRLNYSAPSDEQITDGISRLALTMKELGIS